MEENHDIIADSNKENESQEGITVAIRMRPLNRIEGDRQRIWKVLPKYNSVTQTTSNGKPLSDRVTGRTFFTFDKVFGEDSNTTQVYDSVAKNIVSSVVNGLNGTIFAYGQTSSGKTFTMQGSGTIEEGATSAGGVVHMAARDIFSHIQSQPNRMFLVRASFLEIYNEEVRDLLSNSHHTLQIREDPRRGVFVQSQEEMVTDFSSLLKLLFQGEKSRAVASTGMNERSSRSHTIFRITIESREKYAEDGDGENDFSSSGDGAVRISTLNLVDLAGSESVRHTGATGDRQKEGGMINQSLLTLSRVIVALGQPNQMHINFRDSKLTRILQPSLSGNARMAVICCATPSEMYLEETRSTLQFASRAKLVKTNAQVNEVLDDRSIIRRLQKELAEARGQKTGPGTEHLRALESKAASADTAAMEAKKKFSRLKDSILNASYIFGGKADTNDRDGSDFRETKLGRNLLGRKRRHSDGIVPMGLQSTPAKSKDLVAEMPRTAPRKKKEKKSHVSLSPNSELSILRQALASRGEVSRSLKFALETNSKVLFEKEKELSSLTASNEELAEEKDKAFIQLASVQDALELAETNLEATISEYGHILAEKDSQIIELSENVDAETTKVSGLEATNASLLDQLNDLQRKFDSLQEERVRSAFELAQNIEEKEKLQQVKQQDSNTISELNKRISILIAETNNAQVERRGAENTIRELQEQILSSSGENVEMQRRLIELEAMNADTQRKLDETLQASKTTEKNLESQLKEIFEEKESLTLRVSELEDCLAKKEEEMVQMDQESRDQMSIKNEEISRMMESNADLQNQLEKVQEEKEDAVNHSSSLENDLASCEEKLTGAYATIKELDDNASNVRDELERAFAELQSNQHAADALKNESTCRIAELEAEIIKLRDESEKSKEDLRESFTLRISELEDCLAKKEEEMVQMDQESRDQMSIKNEEISRMMESNADLQNQLEKVQEEKEDVVNRSSWLENDLASYEEKLTGANTTIKELEDNASNVRDELERANAELQSHQHAADALKNESTCRIAELEAEIIKLRDESRKTIQDLDAKLQLIVSEKEDAVFAVQQAKEQIVSLQSRLDSNHRELEIAQTSAVALHAAFSEATEKNIFLENELEKYYSREAANRDQFEGLQIEHAQLQQEIDESDRRLVELETLLADSGRETTLLSSKIESILKEKSDLEAQLIDRDELMAGYQKELSNTRTIIEQLDEEKSSFEIEHKKLKCDFAELQSNYVTLRTQVTSKEIEKSNLVTQVGALTDELEKLRAECVSFESTVEHLKQIENTLRAELEDKGGLLMMAEEELANLHQETKEALLLKAREVDNLLCHKDAMREEIDEVRKANDVTSNDLAVSRNAIETLSREKEELKQLIVKLGQEKDQLEGELAAIETQSMATREDKNALEAKALELQSLLSSLQNEFYETSRAKMELEELHCELEGTVSSYQEDIAASKLEVQQLNNTINLYEAEKVELESRLMAIEAEKMSVLAEKDSMQLDHHDQIEELEKRLLECEEQIELLSSEKAEIAVNVENYQTKIQSLEAQVDSTSESNEVKISEMIQRLEDTTTEMEQLRETIVLLGSNKESLESQVEDLQKLLSETTASMEQEIQDALTACSEASNSLSQCQLDLESARSSRENALATLRDRERERDEAVSKLEEAYEKVQTLTSQLNTSLSIEKRGDFENEISALKQTNLELKQLLASSTGSESRLREELAMVEEELYAKGRDLDDAQYRLSQLEEELRQAEITFEEKRVQDSTNFGSGYDELMGQVEKLELELEQERLDRKTSEDSLRKQMGDEQRALIQEGETVMEALRLRVSELDKRVKETEDEAYLSRQQVQDLKDEKIEAESMCEKLTAELIELRGAKAQNDSQISTLEANLSKALAESFAFKENAVELREKARNATANMENISLEKDMAVSELNLLKRQISNIEKSRDELRDECDRLKAKLRSSDQEMKPANFEQVIQRLEETVASRDLEIRTLRKTLEEARENKSLSETIKEIDRLKIKIKEKDQRIKKLQTFKLTKEFAEEHKQLKKDNKSLRDEVAKLRSDLSASYFDSEMRTEISELRFDKEALERKLRKFAAHCQRLEDDKASMASALRSCSFDIERFNGDLNEAVIFLCDQYASVQESGSAHSSHHKRMTKELEARTQLLQTELDNAQQSEKNLSEQLLRSQRESDELRKHLKSMEETKNDISGRSGEARNKLRYLEQENLQLMLDVKTTKKQLQAAREELEVLRMNAMDDDSTLDFGTVDLASDSTEMSKGLIRKEPSPQQAIKVPLSVGFDGHDRDDNQNSRKENVPNKSENKRPAGRLPAIVKPAASRKKAPGLGEPALQGDETGECKQS